MFLFNLWSFQLASMYIITFTVYVVSIFQPQKDTDKQAKLLTDGSNRFNY